MEGPSYSFPPAPPDNNFLNASSLEQSSLHREWKPTPVFLPGESQGQRSLVGGRLWGRTESDTTEVT